MRISIFASLLPSNTLTIFNDAPTDVPTLHGAFVVNGGSGRDLIDVAGRILGDTTIRAGGNQDFASYVSTTTDNTLDITLGDGDDTMLLGGSLGDGTVDGGSGTDRVTRPADMNPELSLLNFETETVNDQASLRPRQQRSTTFWA